MVLPGLGGYWLDHRLGVSFLAVAGFVIGGCLGVWHLMVITRRKDG